MIDTPRPQRPSSELLELLTERDLLILKDLEQLRMLSTRQIQRLRFFGHQSTTSGTRTAIRVLGRLERHGLLVRLARRVGGSVRGSAATVWQLASTGERVLRHLAGEQTRRRYIEPSPRFSAHALAVADLAVSLFEADRTSRLDLLELQPEPDCWREYSDISGQHEWLKPDLYVVTADSEFETHSFIEVDLNTEHLPAIIRKCQRYQRYFAAGHEQRISGVFPAVIWITTDQRVDKLAAALTAEPSLTTSLFHVTTMSDALRLIAPPSANPKGGTS